MCRRRDSRLGLRASLCRRGCSVQTPGRSFRVLAPDGAHLGQLPTSSKMSLPLLGRDAARWLCKLFWPQHCLHSSHWPWFLINESCRVSAQLPWQLLCSGAAGMCPCFQGAWWSCANQTRNQTFTEDQKCNFTSQKVL